jgi:outer membrane protein TolC
MGLPANVPYDIEVLPDSTVPLGIIDSVDTLIARAVRERPDLAAQRALAEQARARVSVARSQALPSLSVGGTASQTYFVHNPPTLTPPAGNSYNATLTLSIPIFSGWSQIYNVKAASAAADAAALRAHGFEQQVVYQVFNGYYALRTSTQQVRTSRDLLASATESEQVALGRYKAGAGSLLDLLTAQAALASARAQAIQVRFAWNTSLAQLAHDVGILGLDGTSPLRMQTDTTGTGR